MTIALTAKWTAKQGHEDKVHQAVVELAKLSRREPGNLFYQPNRDPDNPRVFLFYEQYVDQAAFEAHFASEHVQRLAVETAIPLLESRERTFYETVGPLDRDTRGTDES
jgi:quinol monooxygenase YgiN